MKWSAWRAAALAAVLALVPVLTAGEFTASIDPGEQLDIKLAGNTGVEIVIVDLATRRPVARVTAAPDAYADDDWTGDFHFHGGPPKAGAVSFVVNDPTSASVHGLAPGSYQIIFGSAQLYVYDSYQSGSAYFFHLEDYWSDDAVEVTFDIW